MRPMLPLLLAAACAPQAPFPEIVALTDMNGPVLQRVSMDAEVVRADQADLHRTLAIAIDLDLATDALFTQHAALLAEARSHNIPLLFDNAWDADRIADLVGVGAEGDAVMFHPYAGGGRLTVYEQAMPAVSTRESTTRPVGMLADWHALSEREQDARLVELGIDRELVTGLQTSPVDTEPLPVSMVMTPGQHFDAVAEHIRQALRSPVSAHASRVTFNGNTTPGQRSSFWVDYVADYLTLDGQTARLNLNHYVDLVYASANHKKYTVVTADNGDISPGPLNWTEEGNTFSNANIGWYRDRFEVRNSLTAPATLLHHTADGANDATSYTTTNNCTFTGSTGTFACGSASGSQSLTDWVIEDQTANQSSKWAWRMVESDAGEYGDPSQLADIWWGGLHMPGTIATSGFTPDFETVWEHDASLVGNANLEIIQEQRLQHVWTKTRWLWQNIYWDTVDQVRQRSITVNYSAVY